jgi:hypothetical protein
MALDILDPDSLATLFSAASLSNLDRTTTWTPSTTTLDGSLGGGSVIVQFSARTDSAANTDFFVDTVSFSATVCP